MPAPTVLALDDDAAACCANAELILAAPAARPRDVDALVCTAAGRDTLESWRVGGHTTPAVLLGFDDDDLAPSQAIPLDPRALRDAVERIVRRRGPQRLVLHHGTADLRTLRFEPHDGASVRLSQREADLLAHLARNSHREVPRDEVQTEVFGHARAVRTRAVDMAVSRLRKKIERDPSQPDVLLTARGGGYRLALPQLDPEGLVGRREALHTVRSALRDARLVTLKGPPGVGKTRLAEVVAEESGARLVRLDAFDSDEQLVVGVAAQLELTTDGPADQEPIDRLLRALDELSPTLLVLDNAEHVVSGLAQLVGAVASDPHLDVTMLVTSQVALELPHEQVVELAPLPPEAARALFLTRATAPPTGDDLDAIISALDGLPLAIELASQWGAVVPWPRVPSLLGRDDPSLTARLRAAWELLAPTARRVLEGLASFAQEVSLDDLEAVVDQAAGGLRDLLAASLVQRHADQYRLLAPVRRFVRAHGPHRHEADEAHHRYLAHSARAAHATFTTREGPRARRRLAHRHADLDRAYAHRPDGWLALGIESVQRTHGHPDARRAIIERAFAAETRPHPRLAMAMVRLDLHPSQRLGELTRDLVTCIDAADDPLLIARARVAVAWARYRLDPDPAFAQDARRYARQVGATDAERMAEFLVSSHAVRGDATALRDALPTWERIVDDLESLEAYPYALRAAASVASTWASLGDVARAKVGCDTLARLLSAWPDAYYEGALLNLRAYQHQDEGDMEAALEAFEAMRRLRFGRRGSPDAVWRKNRAMVLLDAGRVAEAERELEVSIPRLENLAHLHSSACDLLALAYLDQGHPDRAWKAVSAARIDELTGVSLAYHRETRALIRAFQGSLDEAQALWATLDADSLGEQPAVVFHGYRAAVDLPGARTRAGASRLDTVVPRSLRELLVDFDEPSALHAFLNRRPPAPILTRLVARLRLTHLVGDASPPA